ncbi:MAG: hypothetical protein RBT11_07130 [Desulfobacterales bacterium]|jgi:hypothetical protein|nr:hypothetical protein [Desulfobacterales bacterium]
MEKIKNKLKRELNTQALADFLCRLGNEFTTRHTLSGADIANPFERLELLELKIKPKGKNFTVRIKTEHAQMPDKAPPHDSPERSGE